VQSRRCRASPRVVRRLLIPIRLSPYRLSPAATQPTSRRTRSSRSIQVSIAADAIEHQRSGDAQSRHLLYRPWRFLHERRRHRDGYWGDADFTSSTMSNWPKVTINGGATVNLTPADGRTDRWNCDVCRSQYPRRHDVQVQWWRITISGRRGLHSTGMSRMRAGRVAATSCTKLIVDTITFTGNSNFAINCDAYGTKAFGRTGVRLVFLGEFSTRSHHGRGKRLARVRLPLSARQLQ